MSKFAKFYRKFYKFTVSKQPNFSFTNSHRTFFNPGEIIQHQLMPWGPGSRRVVSSVVRHRKSAAKVIYKKIVWKFLWKKPTNGIFFPSLPPYCPLLPNSCGMTLDLALTISLKNIYLPSLYTYDHLIAFWALHLKKIIKSCLESTSSSQPMLLL